MTEAVRRKPYSVVLFDEIEKAHPDVFNILLQVLDDGRLTDNKGRVVNFKNNIIMTSNLGSHLIMEKGEGAYDEVMDMLKQTIRPEFLNRIDEIMMFHPLKEDEIRQIVRLQVNSVIKMLRDNDIEMEVTENAIGAIAKAGFDPEFGARPVKRALQKELLNELSKKMLSGEVNRDSKIVVDAEGEHLVFHN